MSNRKPIYFSSDWHLGHFKVLELDQRPFVDLDHMHRVLINNYNSAVPKDGVCYFLGDVGLTKGSFLKDIISKLNGIKILVLGNHDKGINAMYGLGFDCVVNGVSMVIAGETVTLSHCPLLGVFREDASKMTRFVAGDNWHGEHKNQKYSFHDHGQFHLHGHIHSKPSDKILEKQFDVGVRANNYRPVSLSEIESWIANYNKIKSV